MQALRGMIKSTNNSRWEDIGARTLEVYGETLQAEGNYVRLLTMRVYMDDPVWEGFVFSSTRGLESVGTTEVARWREERLREQE